jgi:RNA polymerase sigma-70 factor (ECF subfamily)
MRSPDAESRLVSRCLAGKAEAWDALCKDTRPYLKRVLGAYRFGPDEAEDICQDLFARVWEDRQRVLGAFEGRSPLRTYLAVIAVRQALRKRSQAPPAPEPLEEAASPGPAPEAALREGERNRVLGQALAGLCNRERLLIRMVYFEGQPVAEAARLLKLEASHASVLLHRARRSLKKAIPEDFL